MILEKFSNMAFEEVCFVLFSELFRSIVGLCFQLFRGNRKG